MKALPLEGLRILDMTMWWSGPMCASYFGALGAEIIKIESIQFPDGFRFTMTVPGEDWWEMGPQFNAANMSKKGITINLTKPEGKELLTELIEKSDVIMENFTPRVFENFGLSYEMFKEINPGIIMMSMPAYGRSGPYKNQGGFAYTFEILSGIAQVNGYKDENPMIVSGVADVISSFHAATGLLAALEYREKTGKGQFIEVAQIEACINMMGQPIADVSINGRNWGRMGNRHPNMAPHGVYRCHGQDAWVAIAIQSDEEWRIFCDILGNPAWAQMERFATIEDRYKHHDELDEYITDWTIHYSHHTVAGMLADAGLAAGPVLEVHEMEDDPFLKDMFQEVSREISGTHLFPAWPVKHNGERLLHQSPAPLIGEHNEYVLKEILNKSESEIAELSEKAIIGKKPAAING